MKNILDQKWDELLKSGYFRARRFDIFGGEMYQIDHSVSQEGLTLSVSSRTQELHGMVGYISDVMDRLDGFKETSSLTGRNNPQKERPSIDQKLENLARTLHESPYKLISQLESGSNCTISPKMLPCEDGVKEAVTLKIGTDLQGREKILKLARSLESAAQSSEIKFLTDQLIAAEGMTNNKNAMLLDDVWEQNSQRKSLGGDKDSELVHTFLKSTLRKYSINDPCIAFKDENPEDQKRDLLSSKNLKDVSGMLYTNQAYDKIHTIEFDIPSENFCRDYNSLFADLKGVFNGVYSVFPNPDPSVSPLDPERHLTGTRFKMSVRGSPARLANDIRKAGGGFRVIAREPE